MRRLTKVEERQIIKRAIEEDCFLSNGSSRAVYSLGDGTCLKVALDKKGQFQNHIEIETFFHHGKTYFAEIFSYGKYVVVMEEVEVIEEAEDFIWQLENIEYEEGAGDGITCTGEIEIDGSVRAQIDEILDA